MIKNFKKTHFLYILVDLFFTGLVYGAAYILRYNCLRDLPGRLNLPYFREYFFIFILWSVFIIIFFERNDLYSTDRGITIPKEMRRVFLNTALSAILISGFIFFAQYKFFSRKVFLLDSILFFLALSGWRLVKRIILRRLIAKGLHNINILVVGIGEKARLILEETKKIPWWGFKVVGFLDDEQSGAVDGLPILGRTQDFIQIAKKYFIEEVIISDPVKDKNIAEIIEQAKSLHLGVRIIPGDLFESIAASDISYLGPLPLLTYKERTYHPTDYFIKRLFDFIISLILLILLSPVFLIIAILIKLDSSGVVFYVQKRAGLKGMLFNLYKFRSMIKNADALKAGLLQKNEAKGGVIFKMKKDPRVTRIGSFLRKYSLDELPQLFNVLKGDISLVGPRPPLFEEVGKYDYTHMERLSIRPGITGLSQIRGRSNLSFQQGVKWDLWYINNWSIGLDSWILWQSIVAVIKGEGAY